MIKQLFSVVYGKKDALRLQDLLLYLSLLRKVITGTGLSNSLPMVQLGL